MYLYLEKIWKSEKMWEKWDFKKLYIKAKSSVFNLLFLCVYTGFLNLAISLFHPLLLVSHNEVHESSFLRLKILDIKLPNISHLRFFAGPKNINDEIKYTIFSRLWTNERTELVINIWQLCNDMSCMLINGFYISCISNCNM